MYGVQENIYQKSDVQEIIRYEHNERSISERKRKRNEFFEEAVE